MIQLMSTNIQYSLRRARPWKTAYFLSTSMYQCIGFSTPRGSVRGRTVPDHWGHVTKARTP